MGRNTPRWPLGGAVRSSESDLRWGRSATHTTTLSRRASSPAWNARCSIEITSGHARKPVRRSSPGSRGGQLPPSSFVPGIPVAKAVRTGVRVHKLRASDAFASDCAACKIDESIENQDSTSEHEKEDIHQPNHSLTKDRPPNRGRSTLALNSGHRGRDSA